MSDAGAATGTTEAGFAGQMSPTNATSDYNAVAFIVRQLQALQATATVVKVTKVTVDGEVSVVGTVDVQPLVKLVDGILRTQSHGIVHKLPFFRLQGGKNAVIIDPAVDDIGIVVCADRDISTVKSAKKESPPGSRRRFSLSDGMYLGGVLNEAPEQYVLFKAAGGIKVVDKFANIIETGSAGITITDANSNTIVMNSDGITINGVLIDSSGNISNAGTVDATGEGTFDGHTVGAHIHAGGTIGSGDTDPPTG